MRGAATKSMSDIVEERQQSRCPPAAAPLRAAARRPAGFVARSSHTAPGIARRSRLASGPGGQQQNGNLFLREPLDPQVLHLWLDTYQTGKDFTRRGIVEVVVG